MLVVSKMIKKCELRHLKDVAPVGTRTHDPCVEFVYENYHLNNIREKELLSSIEVKEKTYLKNQQTLDVQRYTPHSQLQQLATQ